MHWRITKNCTKNYIVFLQIPIALVAPGKQPVTVQEKRACTSSGFTQVFSNADHHLDLPAFPIVLVSNGIYHMIPTAISSTKKLIDWRLGLSLYHLTQSRALFDEAQVEMLLDKNPDTEFVKCQTQLFINLSSTAKQFLQTRAKHATGVPAISSKATLGGDTSKSFAYKGQIKDFAAYHQTVTKIGYSVDTEVPSQDDPIAQEAAVTNTTGAAAPADKGGILPPPPPPPPPVLSSLLLGTSFASPVILSSDSDVGSPAAIPTPISTSQPIENTQIVKITSGYNKGKVTGKKRLKKYQISSFTPHHEAQKRVIKCTYPGCSHSEQRKSDMDDHNYVVHQGGQYMCSQCPKTFTRKRAKVRHEKVMHDGKKPF